MLQRFSLISRVYRVPMRFYGSRDIFIDGDKDMRGRRFTLSRWAKKRAALMDGDDLMIR